MGRAKGSGIVLEPFSEIQIVAMLIQYKKASLDSLVDTSRFPMILVVEGLKTQEVDFAALYEEVRNS